MEPGHCYNPRCRGVWGVVYTDCLFMWAVMDAVKSWVVKRKEQFAPLLRLEQLRKTKINLGQNNRFQDSASSNKTIGMPEDKPVRFRNFCIMDRITVKIIKKKIWYI
jgi:hypothetical protein